MIEFLTLLLGLVAGPATVEVAVSEGAKVAAVELRLDGETVARRESPPWRFVVDFGEELVPHRLHAVALDPGGRELARTTQTVNVPRPPAEARLVLDRGTGGMPRSAAVAWDVLWPAELEQVVVTLDGRVLPDAAPEGFDLPALDPSSLHVLTAELSFAGGLRATAEAVFGGAYGDRVETELTGVPLRHPRQEIPSARALAGRFRAGGRAPAVVAVERPGADVVLVRDTSAQRHLQRLVSEAEASYRRLHRRVPRDLLPLGGDDRLRLVWTPLAAVAGDPRHPVLPPGLFGDVRGTWGRGLDLGVLLVEGETGPVPERIADAVAVAGRMAASGNRPRAVVLVADPSTPDSSRHPPARVRRYLERLRVPLEVWSTTGEPLPGWGEVRPVDGWTKLQEAARQLRSLLRSQSVVWLEGDHLLAEVTLAPPEDGLALAGEP